MMTLIRTRENSGTTHAAAGGRSSYRLPPQAVTSSMRSCHPIIIYYICVTLMAFSCAHVGLVSCECTVPLQGTGTGDGTLLLYR